MSVEELKRRIGWDRMGEWDLSDCARALGILLSFRAGGLPSRHEVVRDVRRLMDLVREPPGGRRDEIAKLASMEATLFGKRELDELYRAVIHRTLTVYAERIRGLHPRTAEKLLNLTLDAVYEVARRSEEERRLIWKILKGGKDGEE